MRDNYESYTVGDSMPPGFQGFVMKRCVATYLEGTLIGW